NPQHQSDPYVSSSWRSRTPILIDFGVFCEFCGYARQSLQWPARIEPIAKSVAEEIESEHEQRDGETRKDREVRRVEDMGASSVQHRAPARCGRLNAKTEEAQRGFTDDRTRHSERGLHDQRRHGGRNHVTPENARRAGAN